MDCIHWDNENVIAWMRSDIAYTYLYLILMNSPYLLVLIFTLDFSLTNQHWLYSACCENWLHCHSSTLTYAAGTRLHCTPPTNEPTPCIQDYQQSLTHSYALQLCSFTRLTVAVWLYVLWNKLTYIMLLWHICLAILEYSLFIKKR